jgi:hypothetical protein
MPTEGRPDRYDVVVSVRPGKLVLGGRLGPITLTLRVAR